MFLHLQPYKLCLANPLKLQVVSTCIAHRVQGAANARVGAPNPMRMAAAVPTAKAYVESENGGREGGERNDGQNFDARIYRE